MIEESNTQHQQQQKRILAMMAMMAAVIVGPENSPQAQSPKLNSFNSISRGIILIQQ